MDSVKIEQDWVDLGHELGHSFDLENLQAILTAPPAGTGLVARELTQPEFETVTGGGWNFPCVHRTPAPPSGGIPIPYPCYH